MSKPEKVPVEGKNYFAWKYEEQTQIKHKVLAYYFHIWIGKLGKWHDTLFMDCHGGCGAYIDKEGKVSFGSSIQANEIALKINKERKHKNYICACEKDKKNFENLKHVWEDQACTLGRLKNLDFNIALQDERLRRFYMSHPTLFLIDPFGYDLKMENMSNLMHSTGSEIIINFMFDHLNRFLNMEEIDDQRDAYFGCHDWIKALQLTGDIREEFLVDLYKRKLKEATGAKFVFAYRLCHPDKRQTYYYLVHATNNIDGIANMKDSFAQINNGRMEYLGRYQNELTIFDLDLYKSNSLVQNVLKVFSGKTMTFISVLESIIEDVPFLQKDLSEALKTMEKEGKATITRVSSKRGRYKDLDEITFGEIE